MSIGSRRTSWRLRRSEESETAYLVDKEAFDKQRLDELGALDAIEACGMYVGPCHVQHEEVRAEFFP